MQVRRFFVFLIFYSITFGAYSQVVKETNKFKSLRVGRFRYVGKYNEISIVRNKKTQTELSDGGKSALILDISWVNDSTYVLVLKKVIGIHGCLEIGDRIDVRIYEVNGRKYSYTYTTASCGSGESTIVKLE